MKTSELTGAALNWAVNYAEGLRGIFAPVDYCGKWEHGGPIIERERITLLPCDNDFEAQSRNAPLQALDGPTPLIAAMRCYVASKLGADVDVPEGL
jgi:hypothetical protein